MDITRIGHELTSRYSSWFVVLFLGLWLLSKIIFNVVIQILGYKAQTFIWLFIIFIPTFIPAFSLFVILIYNEIRSLEKTFLKFRIKNSLVQNNIFILIFITLFIIGIITFLCLICNEIYIIFINENIRNLFFTFGIILLLGIIPIFLFIKQILYNIINNKSYK